SQRVRARAGGRGRARRDPRLRREKRRGCAGAVGRSATPRRLADNFSAAMIFISATAITLLVIMLSIALVNLLFSYRLESAPAPRARVKVSLLIPARNEEENLRQSLVGILAIDHPDLEVIVLDDGSTDQTVEVVARAV